MTSLTELLKSEEMIDYLAVRTVFIFHLNLNLKTSVGWCLECFVFYFWQGAMRRNNQLLQRIATPQKLKNNVL